MFKKKRDPFGPRRSKPREVEQEVVGSVILLRASVPKRATSFVYVCVSAYMTVSMTKFMLLLACSIYDTMVPTHAADMDIPPEPTLESAPISITR